MQVEASLLMCDEALTMVVIMSVLSVLSTMTPCTKAMQKPASVGKTANISSKIKHHDSVKSLVESQFDHYSLS